jgi:hypothetical protein
VGCRFFFSFLAVSEVMEKVKYRAWLVKVTNAVNQHWHSQNARKKNWMTSSWVSSNS